MVISLTEAIFPKDRTGTKIDWLIDWLIGRLINIGFTTPQHYIGCMAPVRRTSAGATPPTYRNMDEKDTGQKELRPCMDPETPHLLE